MTLTKVSASLVTFNCFGLIAISPKKVIVTITAIQDSKVINRVFTQELQRPIAEAGGRTVTATFAAFVDTHSKPRVTVREIGEALRIPIINIPAVDKLLDQATRLIQEKIA